MPKNINIRKLDGLHVLEITESKSTIDLDFCKMRQGTLNLLSLAMESDLFNDYKIEISKYVSDVESLLHMLED